MDSTQRILNIANELYLYSGYVCLISGIVGNVFNIMIFMSLKAFRGSHGAFYLIVESITDIGVVLNIFLLRILQMGFGIHAPDQSFLVCKMRIVLLEVCVSISLTSTCFGAIDQYVTTRRSTMTAHTSALRIARLLTILNIIIWSLHGIPFGIFYEIVPGIGCTISNRIFQIYFSFVYLIFVIGTVPLVINAIFSALAYRNVRRVVRQQLAAGQRRLNRQLTAIVLTRAVYLVLVSIPYGVNLIYQINTINNHKTPLRAAAEELVATMTSTLFYINYAWSFYLFLLTSKRFRSQFKHLILRRTCLTKLWRKRRNTVVHPIQIAPVSIVSANQ